MKGTNSKTNTAFFHSNKPTDTSSNYNRNLNSQEVLNHHTSKSKNYSNIKGLSSYDLRDSNLTSRLYDLLGSKNKKNLSKGCVKVKKKLTSKSKYLSNDIKDILSDSYMNLKYELLDIKKPSTKKSKLNTNQQNNYDTKTLYFKSKQKKFASAGTFNKIKSKRENLPSVIENSSKQNSIVNMTEEYNQKPKNKIVITEVLDPFNSSIQGSTVKKSFPNQKLGLNKLDIKNHHTSSRSVLIPKTESPKSGFCTPRTTKNLDVRVSDGARNKETISEKSYKEKLNSVDSSIFNMKKDGFSYNNTHDNLAEDMQMENLIIPITARESNNRNMKIKAPIYISRKHESSNQTNNHNFTKNLIRITRPIPNETKHEVTSNQINLRMTPLNISKPKRKTESILNRKKGTSLTKAESMTKNESSQKQILITNETPKDHKSTTKTLYKMYQKNLSNKSCQMNFDATKYSKSIYLEKSERDKFYTAMNKIDQIFEHERIKHKNLSVDCLNCLHNLSIYKKHRVKVSNLRGLNNYLLFNFNLGKDNHKLKLSNNKVNIVYDHYFENQKRKSKQVKDHLLKNIRHTLKPDEIAYATRLICIDDEDDIKHAKSLTEVDFFKKLYQKIDNNSTRKCDEIQNMKMNEYSVNSYPDIFQKFYIQENMNRVMTLKNIIKGNSDMDKDVNSKDIVNFKKNIRKEVPNYYRISSQLIPAFINKKFKLNTVRRFVEANGLNFGLQRDRNSN